jgi:GNAT superfamily N-acetyltransferase
MRIQKLDPAADDSDLDAILPLLQACMADAMPGFPIPKSTRVRFWCADGTESATLTYAAFDEESERAIGVICVGLPSVQNRRSAFSTVWVGPDARGRGIGSALHAEALKLAAEHGRTRLSYESPATVNVDRFVARHGGKLVTDDIRSVLDLTAVDRGHLAELAAPNAKNAEYTLVRWIDHCPDEYLRSFCVAMAAMADAPTGEFDFEHQTHDAEKLRKREQNTANHGWRRHTLAAVAPTGEIAGFTLFGGVADEHEVLDIWDTGVARAHRGHGLGLRLKAASTLWMLDAYPEARWAPTYNDAENEHMLAVNRALGYMPSEHWMRYEFVVPGTDATD